ncbi:UNVERIFIED_CONTAM: NUDIX hydrolase, partial [Kocuria sp. CPCC 205274]
MLNPKFKTSERIADAYMNIRNNNMRRASLVLVVAQDTGRVLVVLRHKDGQIGLPCGKIEHGEVAREAAKRELKEETGLDVQYLSELYFSQAITFEGCHVNIYHGIISKEISVSASKGFEKETSPYWIDPEELANTASHF